MDDISLVLKHDEALVFFEWLSLLEEKNKSEMFDEAEQKVIWKIEGQLESQLPDVVMDDYNARVVAAKSRL